MENTQTARKKRNTRKMLSPVSYLMKLLCILGSRL
nr:MAG TPA: hypothetical protein [Bacteriophage sp.]